VVAKAPARYLDGEVLEWKTALLHYRPGRSPSVIGRTHITVTAIVRERRNGSLFAKADSVEGWPYGADNSTQEGRLRTRFRKKFGLSLWGLRSRLGNIKAEPKKPKPLPVYRAPPVRSMRDKVSTLVRGGCPRCYGAVQRDYDEYGGYDTCLQCGWTKDV